MVDVTVVIINFNTFRLTSECIESVIASNPKCSYEIVVVDNGSDDGSRVKFTKINNPKVRFIYNNDNLGFSTGCNMAIKIANGKNVYLLNSDTTIGNGALDKLLEFSRSENNIGVVGTKLINRNGTVQASVYNFPTVWRAIRQYWLHSTKVLDKYEPLGSKPVQVEVVVGGSFFITEKSLKKVGLLNEKYFMYFEDFDYCKRVHKAHLKVFYFPGVEVQHFHGASGKALASSDNQWKRLIPSSKIYHGTVKHYVITFIIWSSQKWQKFFGKRH